MATRDRTKPVGLRLFDGWPLDPPDSHGGARGPVVARAPSDSGGDPKVIGRVSGYPLEARVWRSRPAATSEAIWHPAGIWLAVRLLDPIPV